MADEPVLYPDWLLRPLPANAETDSKLNEQVVKLGEKLPANLTRLNTLLNNHRYRNSYEEAVNLACGLVYQSLASLLQSEEPMRMRLLHFARDQMTDQARNRIIRRLVKDSSTTIRRAAIRLVKQTSLREVALPTDSDGEWNEAGWLHGVEDRKLSRHKTGQAIQQLNGVPVLRNVLALRKLLKIKSPEQLGYFLLATDAENGPYVRFTIPKKSGKEREICAPKTQLCWVQRRILDEILSKVAPHPAAHGFVVGRSTVTNAAPHLGAEVILKFDLTDFFPTIHYYRVVGMFARLGYPVADARFSTDDAAKNMAPVLARLCCHTPNARQWGTARLPQGAPTSPAISNLVCRRMDARLEGLAKRNNGVYTRYADDLTFSFKTADGVDIGRFRWWVNQICHQEGFFINEPKFRVIRSSQRQIVTGIVVNDALRVPRDERRTFRAILHNCRVHGIESQARGNPKFTQYLRGFASYVNMVHPEEGQELMQQVLALLGPDEGGES